MADYPDIEVLEIQFNDDDANKAASQLQAVIARNPDLVGVSDANLFSAIGAADGVKSIGKTGEIKVVAFDAPQRIVDDIKSGLIDMAISGNRMAASMFRCCWIRSPPSSSAVPASSAGPAPSSVR